MLETEQNVIESRNDLIRGSLNSLIKCSFPSLINDLDVCFSINPPHPRRISC